MDVFLEGIGIKGVGFKVGEKFLVFIGEVLQYLIIEEVFSPFPAHLVSPYVFFSSVT